MFSQGGLLRSLGSRQIRKAPFFLGTTTMELIQGVGSVTGAMMSCLTRSSRVTLRISPNGTGTRRGACCTGSILGSSLMVDTL